jgi:hypothetical protein
MAVYLAALLLEAETEIVQRPHNDASFFSESATGSHCNSYTTPTKGRASTEKQRLFSAELCQYLRENVASIADRSAPNKINVEINVINAIYCQAAENACFDRIIIAYIHTTHALSPKG